MVMPTGTTVRRIIGARLSAPLRDALGPALSDRDELSAMVGVPRALLDAVIDGVPRKFSIIEQVAVRRLASLIAAAWSDFVYVDLTIDHDAPEGRGRTRTAQTPRLVKTRGDREACSGGNLTPIGGDWDK